MSNFTHLHVHSEFSLLDGALRLPAACEKAKSLGMKALALTDHGNMHGYVQFYKAALAAGIKPILGCEVYVAPRRLEDKTPDLDSARYHLTLLAENEAGFRNLVELVSVASLEGFYYKPRIDKRILEAKHEGLIALSGCLAGEIPTLIRNRNHTAARELAEWFARLFGPDRFYLELMDTGLKEQREVNEFLIALADELSIPLVATNDVHYLNADDAEAQDILLCIQTGTNLADAKRLKMDTDQYYFKSGDEMAALFENRPDAAANTGAVAELCNVELTLGKMHFPGFELPEDMDANSYLDKLCAEGIEARYGPDPAPEVIERMNHELGIIKSMDYAGYFLIVSDFIRHARETGVWVGPGRGSAAGSLVSYLLGITDIDPLRYKLIFERFLNPERISMPDIDIDFCQERRGEVIDYVFRKYGSDKVAQIVTFGTMKTRQVVRDVGRALGLAYAEVDAVAKLIPVGPGIKTSIPAAIESEPELFNMVRDRPEIKRLMAVAEKLEGLARHRSIHAAGVVIANQPLLELTPVQRSEDTGGMVTQLTMNEIEDIGLLKMDFLGLRTLTVMRDALEIIESVYGEKIDLGAIPLDDPAVFENFGKGETDAVFQFESDGMKKLLRGVKPAVIEDLFALNALYRPGPMDLIPQYTARKNGREKVHYMHPLMEPILEETYGVMIYQEQVMQTAMELGGFSAGKADVMRRAMGKKKEDEMQKLRAEFVGGCAARGIEDSLASEIFDHVEKFAGYGFNKSHSAAYGLTAYQTMYLKTHYPLAYMAAEINSRLGKMDEITKAVNSCRRMGISIMPPDVNVCDARFTVVEGRIRFGLAAVKNVGLGAIESLVAERIENGEFRDIYDLCARVDLRHVNRKALESLIKSGACDSLEGNRARMLAALDRAVELGARLQRDRDSGQISLFGDDDPAAGVMVGRPPLPEVAEFDGDQLLKFEKELLGLYVSRHPLDSVSEWMRRRVDCEIESLHDMQPGRSITLGGIVTVVRRSVTQKGDAMARLTLEDFTGGVDMMVFPKTLAEYSPLIHEDAIVLVRGRLDIKENRSNTGDEELIEPTIIVDKVTVADAGVEINSDFPARPPDLHVKLSARGNGDEDLLRIRDLVESHPGDARVFLHVAADSGEFCIELGDRFTVAPGDGFLDELRGVYNVIDVWKE